MPQRRWIIAGMLAAALISRESPLAAQRPRSGPVIRRIRHLVVIIQENVSFDHYFATYPVAANPPGEPMFNARSGTPSVNRIPPALMSSNPNLTKPFRLDRSRQYLCNPSPYYPGEQRAYHSGALDRFPESTGQTAPGCEFGLGTGIVMGYYDGNTVTALWNYAQNFAMGDNFFGTTYGQSAPGHVNIVSGQTHGALITQAVGDTTTAVVEGTMYADAGAAYDDCGTPGRILVAMTGTNVGDLLNSKGVSWGWFGAGFTPTSRNADGSVVCGASHRNIEGNVARDWYAGEPFQRYASTANPHHLPPTSTSMIGYSDQANHQYDLDSFWDVANAGNLPAVSFIKAPTYQNGHPQTSSPLDEQTFLVDTINRLQKLPAWESMAIILTWDDSGGWYDHVMPPLVNYSNTAMDWLTGENSCGTPAPGSYQGRCGYGPRIPFLAVSPWAKVNFIDHSITDQSSILRFIEDNWGLGRIGDQSFDEKAGSLLNLFDFRQPGASRLFLDPQSGQRMGVQP